MGAIEFEENIRVFISAECYENLIMDIFQSEDIFSKQYYFIDTIQNVLFQLRK